MSTIKEIQAELREIVAALSDKGVVRPEAQIHVQDSGRFAFHANSAYGTAPFDGANFVVFHGETVADVLIQAANYAFALPSPDERIQRNYLSKVAEAIDFGTKHSIEDKYVTPLRGVTKAMTDNLLTKEPTA